MRSLEGTTNMFTVKKMCEEDFEFAVEITDTMSWNMTAGDFEFMISLEPEGCFVLLYNSKKVGVTTTISFGKVGWIGNVIVDEKYRRKGAGKTILKCAINYLKGKGVGTVGLYSYKETIDFYKQFGFKRELDFAFLKGKAFSSVCDRVNIKSLRGEDLQKIVDFDLIHFGASREKLLTKIANKEENLCYYYSENGEIFGYVMAKVYGRYAEIGPLTCQRERSDVALTLLKSALNKLVGFEVSICLPKKEENIMNFLLNAGFKEEFPVTRMFIGPSVLKDCIYIAESLERG